MKILWAEKQSEMVKGNYEYYIEDLKMTVRLYLPNGIDSCTLKMVKRLIPRNFEMIGIYWCSIKRKMHMLIVQK